MSGYRMGRKFMVLVWCVPMWLLLFISVVFLYMKFQSIPAALGISFGTMTSVFPGYLGVNVVQKKIQADETKSFGGGNANEFPS